MESKKLNYKSDNHCIKVYYKSVSDVIIFIILLVICIADLTNSFNSGGIPFLGILLGIIVIILFPYLTFKRPYFKANSLGIYFRVPKGFLYGKEIFIAWNKIDAIIWYDKVFTIHKNNNEIQENELNIESISNLDNFEGYTQEEYEDNIEWIENGLHILTKKTDDTNPEIHEFGAFFNNKYNEKNMETIKRLWIENVKS